MPSRFQLDDQITTKDGRKHRVLWSTKNINGEQATLLVKRTDEPKLGEKHKVKVSSIKLHTRNGEHVRWPPPAMKNVECKVEEVEC